MVKIEVSTMTMLRPLYYTASQLSITFGLAEVRRTWT